VVSQEREQRGGGKGLLRRFRVGGGRVHWKEVGQGRAMTFEV
jgi:hypothetical protein